MEWEDFVELENLGRVCRVKMANEVVMEFEIYRKSNGEIEKNREMWGSIKWDGCCNFMTDPNCYFHICDREEVSDIFQFLYDLALEKMPSHSEFLL